MRKKFIQRGDNIKIIAVNCSRIAYRQGLCLALCCLTKLLQIIFFIDALCNVRVRITSREVFILGGSLAMSSENWSRFFLDRRLGKHPSHVGPNQRWGSAQSRSVWWLGRNYAAYVSIIETVGPCSMSQVRLIYERTGLSVKASEWWCDVCMSWTNAPFPPYLRHLLNYEATVHRPIKTCSV
jgi:hypothetical protein